MILIDVTALCDNCKKVGQGQQAIRWIPLCQLPTPDIPRGWQNVMGSDGSWSNFCPDCKLIPGATK